MFFGIVIFNYTFRFSTQTINLTKNNEKEIYSLVRHFDRFGYFL
jgi:hypothetical protein